MKSMIVALSLMLMATSVTAGQSFVLPRDNKDNPLQGDGYGGASFTIVTASNTETVIFSGKGTLFGFITSTGIAATDYIVFKDTSTTSNAATSSPRVVYSPTESVIVLPKAVRLSNGLVTDNVHAVDGMEYIVIYLDEEL